ncbi:hypothetical protein CLAIMM_10866 [Cladophialophora immunda]|nr:hypothetical protein CLAIMM_10866 [Cladophialophora immunda]
MSTATTRFIHGSHLEATELEPGDGFKMLSSCYHGGSVDVTEDQERLLFSCFMCAGFDSADI